MGMRYTPGFNAAGVLEDDLLHWCPHRDQIDAGFADVAAHADEFQACAAIHALRLVPVDSIYQDLRNVGEGFDVVESGRLAP